MLFLLEACFASLAFVFFLFVQLLAYFPQFADGGQGFFAQVRSHRMRNALESIHDQQQEASSGSSSSSSSQAQPAVSQSSTSASSAHSASSSSSFSLDEVIEID
jgi:predicted PurR-regulated permease PerM